MTITAEEFRLKCREESHTTDTSGHAPGYIQANLVVLPSSVAKDFRDLCLRNPVPCPLLATTPIGNPFELDNKKMIKSATFDIRTDLPKYNVFRKGSLIESKSNILEEWSEKHVGFLIGCSYSFEKALVESGLPPKHMVTTKETVPCFNTTRSLDPSGIFTGCTYVVSMRPYKLSDIEKVRSVTSNFNLTHGSPIDWGYDALERLGIKDLASPDYGKPVPIESDEVPVFWGCGITPQLAIKQVGHLIEDGLVMSHFAGHMMILDMTDDEVVSN